jgi:DNA-binding transcriptional LysR family regulator
MHPQLQLTIASKPFQTLSLLLAGTVDLAIGWFPHIPRMVQKRTLFNSRLHLILPKDHPLTRKRQISPAIPILNTPLEFGKFPSSFSRRPAQIVVAPPFAVNPIQ